MKQKSIYISDETFDKLQKEANSQKRSLNFLINKILEIYYKDKIKKEAHE